MENIKMMAYRFLLEAQIKELNTPLFDLKEILKRRGIALLAYSEAETIRNIIPEDVWPLIEKAMEQNDGLSILCANLTFILYSDELSSSRKIHTIYHELGHIIAGHKRNGIYNFEENKEHECEAERFACYVAAPPCVLNEIGKISSCTVAKLTGLDADLINEALRLVKKEKNDILVADEKELLHQFEAYIYANKIQTNSSKDLQKRIIGICVVILSVFTALSFILLTINTNSMQALANSTAALEPAATQTSPPTVDAETEPVHNNNATVWKAKTGDVYHTDPNCYHIPNTAYTMNLSDAITVGYRKCKDCRP